MGREQRMDPSLVEAINNDAEQSEGAKPLDPSSFESAEPESKVRFADVVDINEVMELGDAVKTSFDTDSYLAMAETSPEVAQKYMQESITQIASKAGIPEGEAKVIVDKLLAKAADVAEERKKAA